jgi:hypothetical protein
MSLYSNRHEDEVAREAAEEVRSLLAKSPTLVDCGCKAKVYRDGSGVEIEYCHLHGAAEEMYSALDFAHRVLSALMDNNGSDYLTLAKALANMDHALRVAKHGPMGGLR